MKSTNLSLSPGNDDTANCASQSTIAPLLDEADSERYTTWVKSSLIPTSREEAPSLEQLCSTLIATLSKPPSWEAFTTEKPLKPEATHVAIKALQNEQETLKSANISTPESKDSSEASSVNGHDLDTRLYQVCPDFTTYAHLEALCSHPEKEVRALAINIRTIFLGWMEDERVEATWVTPNILLDGMLGSLDAATLHALCAAHNFTHVAMLSIHPDDWVVGGAWAAHGRLSWTRRPASAQERAHGVADRLVAPQWNQPAERKPRVIVQGGVAYRSPVTDQLVIPLEDGAGSSLLVHLPDVCTFIAQHDKRPGVLVVVHCKMGLSRSNAALEAFILQAVGRRLREDAGWLAKEPGARQADLLAVLRNYHRAFERRRPDLKDKFPRQLESWAKFLADGEPESGPDYATDKTSAGGEGMRDAAVVACYQANWLLPESLVAHYYKRTGTAKGRSEITICRFRDAERQLRADLERGSDHGNGSSCLWLSLSHFVGLCKATHESRGLRG
ncbi:unnamed protein product [Discula destructiva]